MLFILFSVHVSSYVSNKSSFLECESVRKWALQVLKTSLITIFIFDFFVLLSALGQIDDAISFMESFYRFFCTWH